MVLRFDNDDEVIRNPAVAEIGDAAAIGFIDVKAVQITAELHCRICFIHRLTTRAGRPNGRSFHSVRRDGKPFIYIERLIH
jgi:hypothetical protein